MRQENLGAYRLPRDYERQREDQETRRATRRPVDGETRKTQGVMRQQEDLEARRGTEYHEKIRRATKDQEKVRRLAKKIRRTHRESSNKERRP